MTIVKQNGSICYLDLQTSLLSDPVRVDPVHSHLRNNEAVLCSALLLWLLSRCKVTSSFGWERGRKKLLFHSWAQTSYQRQASSAENNHSCVGWVASANGSEAGDMTRRDATPPCSGHHTILALAVVQPVCMCGKVGWVCLRTPVTKWKQSEHTTSIDKLANLFKAYWDAHL